ncbi:Uncharacterised protein [Mycobacteroides abscessus subsp. abscessus]|nr:Uncharacterised protein [Mycobacteroides abscessus subsp. abscessus]
MFSAVAHRSELGAHPELGDHRTGLLGGLFDIGHRTGGRLPEHEFFGRPAAHREDQLRDHFRPGGQALVILGNRYGVSAGTPTRQDGHLVHPLDIGHGPGSQRVAGLVIRGDLLFVLADDAPLATGTTNDPVDRLLQRGSRDHGAVLTGREQRGLVDHVGKVGTGHADGALGQAIEVDIGAEGLARRMDFEHGLAARQVGAGHRDLPVETTGTQQCRIQDVGAVGRGDQDDTLPVTEAIHLHQQLVQGLFTLVVPTAQAGATLPSDCVDLVDENDAGTVLLGLLKQVTHARSANAHKHFHEVGAGDGKERHSCLTGDRTGQQRLTCAGRAIEQHATRDLGTERLIPRRVLQEVLDLVELLDRLVDTCHVGEGGLGHVLGQLLGTRFTETESHAPAPGLHPAEREEQHHQQDHRQQVQQQRPQDAALVDRRVDGRALAVELLQ